VLKVPVGTVIRTTNLSEPVLTKRRFEPNPRIDTGEAQEILKIGERILIARGGLGGKGNFLFRSAKHTTPRWSQKGLPGERLVVRLELKLIADVGLIGLPNAGKSSLLNELTRAQSRVANYPFTTLEPSLGVYYELILADIPGLIEGASAGKGLGIKFLRHVERTKILFHLISAESENPARDYRIIRKELETYNKELLKKTEYVFLSKTDMVSLEELKKKMSTLKKIKKNILPISINDWDSVEQVKKILNEIKAEKL
jgi:GTP-binding protein